MTVRPPPHPGPLPPGVEPWTPRPENLLALQEEVGLVGYRFNTIGVSDGISMGTGEPAAALVV